MELWPIHTDTALMFTPAAIISDANVWRHSWSPMGRSSATSHAARARRRTVEGMNGSEAVRPNTSASSSRPVSTLTYRAQGRDRELERWDRKQQTEPQIYLQVEHVVRQLEGYEDSPASYGLDVWVTNSGHTAEGLLGVSVEAPYEHELVGNHGQRSARALTRQERLYEHHTAGVTRSRRLVLRRGCVG